MSEEKKRRYHELRNVEMCSRHKPNELGYVAWFDDADIRYKKGERQKQCPICKHYFWKDEL